MEKKLEILHDTITGDPVAIISGECVYSIDTIVTCPTALDRDTLRNVLIQLDMSEADLLKIIDELYKNLEEQA